MSHGGPRKPGPGKKLGRPPVEKPKVRYNTTLAPDIIRYLRSLPKGEAASTIDGLFRRSKGFGEWRKNNPEGE